MTTTNAGTQAEAEAVATLTMCVESMALGKLTTVTMTTGTPAGPIYPAFYLYGKPNSWAKNPLGAWVLGSPDPIDASHDYCLSYTLAKAEKDVPALPLGFWEADGRAHVVLSVGKISNGDYGAWVWLRGGLYGLAGLDLAGQVDLVGADIGITVAGCPDPLCEGDLVIMSYTLTPIE